MEIIEKIKRVNEIREWIDSVSDKSNKEKYVHCVIRAFQVHKLTIEDAQKYVDESLSFWPEVQGALECAKKLGII